jgi:methionine sulfoxide reductase heme-binding subunit
VRDPTFWILARASGLTAYVLLTASVLAGLVLKSRPFGRALKAASVTDVHRFLALLALGAVGVHGLALALDATVKIGVPALVVPGLAAYRPVMTGFGVVSAELAALIFLSFSVRARIGAKAWRRLHWATYAVFVAATVHGLGAGTDTGRSWAFAVYLGAVGSVAFATTWRALTRSPRPTTEGGTRVRDRDRSLAV